MSGKSFVKPKIQGELTKHRQDLLKWNGWGYKDSVFYLSDDDMAIFSGDRYRISGCKMPLLKDYMSHKLGATPDQKTPSQPEMPASSIPVPITNEAFMEELRQTPITFSDDCQDRLFRAHGHTLREVFALREGTYDRVPDLVVWPESHDDAETIVTLATKHNVVIIPYGGGTNVTMALFCPPEEKRMILSVDTSQMSRILWVDPKNMTMRAQAGIVGQELEKQLGDRGFCTGHEPDSMEFSTLGGWVATRASGMKKNIYGNIEDLMVHVKMATPKGVIEKSCQGPRISSGPDIHQFILGSEGTLGLITEVTLKIRHLPKCTRYGSIIFSTFEKGVDCLYDIAIQRCAPASIRVMDNEQFLFGRALRVQDKSLVNQFMESLKRLYITKFKGFNPLQMAVATLLFEGTPEEVTAQEKKIYGIATKYGGIPGGADNGERGYMMTFVITYLRDIASDYYVVGESFETSVPWDRCLDVCQNTKERIVRECTQNGVQFAPFVTCRVTQTYDTGACVYFYFSFNYRGLPDPVEVFERIEACARDEILANGGNISHHHGVGKIRKRWLRKTVGDLGVGSMQAIKQYIDPSNIFGSNNLMMGEPIKDGHQDKASNIELPPSKL